MSLEHTAWAMRQTTGSSSRKAVLIALADHVNKDSLKCCPGIETLASDTELSKRTVQTALADLCSAGFIERARRRRSDGSLAGYHYTFPAVVTQRQSLHALDATAAASPAATVAAQEEPGSKDLEPVEQESVQLVRQDTGEVVATLPTVAPLGKVDRQVVKPEHEQLARLVLSEWNRQTGQSLGSRDWLAKIVMRIREHPDYGIEEHAHVITAALASPWWTGPPTPSVVYGSGAQFERSIVTATSRHTAVEKRRYGIGMTSAEILEQTQGPEAGAWEPT